LSLDRLSWSSEFVPEISNGLAFGLLIIPVLAFLILIHEFGHFFAARSVGVEVEEFGLGIPPRAKGWRRNGVLWSLNWIPFGGFVRVKGEDGKDMSAGSMNSKGPLQRAFFLVAGSAMNFLAAIVLSIIIVAFQGVPDGSSNIYIANVVEQSPAEGAGWLPGDSIHAVNGEVITGTDQLHDAIANNAGEGITVTVRRGDELIDTTLVPRENPPAGQGATGIEMIQGSPSTLKITGVDPGSVAESAGWQSGDRVVSINGISIEAEAQARNLFLGSAGEEMTVVLERDGQMIESTFTMPLPAITLTQVLNGSPANDAMLYPGDEVVAVGDQAVSDAQSFSDLLTAAAGTTVDLGVMREGRALTLPIDVPVIPEDSNAIDAIGVNGRVENPYEAIGADGIIARTFRDVPVSQVIPEGWSQFWEITSGTFGGLRDMVTQGVDTETLVGPVGMGQMTSELLTQSATPVWVTLALITVVISVALGVLNLMPLPALDGGRLLFVLIEVLRGGRRISPEKEGLVHLAGMVVLLGLMFFVAFGDVSRLVDGRSIFP
jgi:regulator of sigma E protease